jgi:hypothetical protein
VHLIENFFIKCELRLQSGPPPGGFNVSGRQYIGLSQRKPSYARLVAGAARFPVSEFPMPHDAPIEPWAEDIRRGGHWAEAIGKLRQCDGCRQRCAAIAKLLQQLDLWS